MNAIWKYYIDSTIFNLGFSAIVGVCFGFIWGLLMIPSFGSFIGILSFSYFKNTEYYFYYNLGFSKPVLIIRTWMINVVVTIILLSGYLLIINLL